MPSRKAHAPAGMVTMGGGRSFDHSTATTPSSSSVRCIRILDISTMGSCELLLVCSRSDVVQSSSFSGL